MKQFLLLVGIIAVVLASIFLSLYVVDVLKLTDLQADLRKTFELLAIAAAAGVLITFLAKAGNRNPSGRP